MMYDMYAGVFLADGIIVMIHPDKIKRCGRILFGER